MRASPIQQHPSRAEPAAGTVLGKQFLISLTQSRFPSHGRLGRMKKKKKIRVLLSAPLLSRESSIRALLRDMKKWFSQSEFPLGAPCFAFKIITHRACDIRNDPQRLLLSFSFDRLRWFCAHGVFIEANLKGMYEDAVHSCRAGQASL